MGPLHVLEHICPADAGHTSMHVTSSERACECEQLNYCLPAGLHGTILLGPAQGP